MVTEACKLLEKLWGESNCKEEEKNAIKTGSGTKKHSCRRLPVVGQTVMEMSPAREVIPGLWQGPSSLVLMMLLGLQDGVTFHRKSWRVQGGRVIVSEISPFQMLKIFKKVRLQSSEKFTYVKWFIPEYSEREEAKQSQCKKWNKTEAKWLGMAPVYLFYFFPSLTSFSSREFTGTWLGHYGCCYFWGSFCCIAASKWPSLCRAALFAYLE